MHRKLITLFLLVSVLLVLGATTLAQDDVITVTWWVEDYVDVDLFNAAIAEPMKVNHPNIDLVITPQDLGTSDILRTSLAAGEAPDILQTPGAAFIAEFLQSGLIYDMTDAAEEFGWEDKLLPWAYQSGIIDGSLYSIPLTYESMVLIYNRTLFEEQGWEVPTNLSEMEAIAEQAIAAGINPFSYGNADWQPTNEHLMSIYFNNYAGPEAVYQALIGEKSWDSPEFVEATELLTTHIADNGWFSGSLETYFAYIWDDFHTEVAQGDAAMMMIGTWGFRGASEFFAETDSEWDWAPLPVLSDNVQDYNYALATGSTLSVNAETENPEAVLTAINWMMDHPQNVLELASGYAYGEFMIPLFFQTEDFPEDADTRIVRFYADFAEVTGEGRVGYTTWTFWPANANVQLWESVENVWFGELGVADYLAEHQALWEQARAEGVTPPVPER